MHYGSQIVDGKNWWNSTFWPPYTQNKYLVFVIFILDIINNIEFCEKNMLFYIKLTWR